MAKKKSEPKEDSGLTKAEKLGPARFTSQQDYEEQVAFEKEAKEKLEEPEEKPDEKTE